MLANLYKNSLIGMRMWRTTMKSWVRKELESGLIMQLVHYIDLQLTIYIHFIFYSSKEKDTVKYK